MTVLEKAVNVLQGGKATGLLRIPKASISGHGDTTSSLVLSDKFLLMIEKTKKETLCLQSMSMCVVSHLM